MFFGFRSNGRQPGVGVFKLQFEFLDTLGGLRVSIFPGGVTAGEFVSRRFKIGGLLFPIPGLRGAFTGALAQRLGRFQLAHNGTLFLDEISALSPVLQGKFLRLLDDGHFNRLGGTQEMISEARIVSSSNADLPALIDEGRFRSDLYYRLNVTELRIPSLRARREDIVSLAEHFISQFSRLAAHRIPALTPAAVTAMLDYGWPGNVRELRHRVQRALDLAAAAPQLSAHMLFPERSLLEELGERVGTLAEARERAERLHIEEALRQTGGEIAKAATLLGISRTTLWEKMRKLQIS